MVDRLPRGFALQALLAFACIYFVWGSTFLAIRVAQTAWPPLLLCGARLLSAGVVLVAIAWKSGAAWPRGAEWRNAALVGLLLPVIGNTSVTLAETHVPSGLTALLVATIPMWMALFASRGANGVRMRPRVIGGLVLGFAGIALLVGPGLPVGAHVDPIWALLPVLGGLSWAWGSVWSRRVAMPRSPLVSTAVGMTAGGLALVVAGWSAGEGERLGRASLAPAPLAAMLYLSLFGSVLAFTAYLWLLGSVAPTRVSTYAFVNPVVAMLLGTLFAHEPFSGRTLAASALVVAAVALIVTASTPARVVSQGLEHEAAEPAA